MLQPLSAPETAIIDDAGIVLRGAILRLLGRLRAYWRAKL